MPLIKGLVIYTIIYHKNQIVNSRALTQSHLQHKQLKAVPNIDRKKVDFLNHDRWIYDQYK